MAKEAFLNARNRAGGKVRVNQFKGIAWQIPLPVVHLANPVRGRAKTLVSPRAATR